MTHDWCKCPGHAMSMGPKDRGPPGFQLGAERSARVRVRDIMNPRQRRGCCFRRTKRARSWTSRRGAGRVSFGS